MQLYLRADFLSPAQSSFFLICMGESTGTGYHHRSRQGLNISTNLYPHKGWERFVDDLYPIIKQMYLENFFQHISNLYCNLKFTMKEESSGELAFFDTLLKEKIVIGQYLYGETNQKLVNIAVILIVSQVARKVSFSPC